MEELVAAVAPGADPWGGEKPHSFILENGVEQLAPYFGQAECRRYDDALLVTEVGRCWPTCCPRRRRHT
jgi:hypothetical protein